MSGKAKKNTDYLFLTAMLRARETKLLTREQLARIIDTPSLEDALAVLPDCGYERLNPPSSEALERSLEKRREELFTELARLAPEPGVVDLFRLRYDYQNAKVLVKLGGEAADDMLSGAGRIPAARFRECVAQGDLSPLPAKLAASVNSAAEILARTGDAQLSDIELDKAWFDELSELAGKVHNKFLEGYVELMASSANLRTAVRAVRMGKSPEFLRNILVAGSSVSAGQVISAALGEKPFAAIFSGRLADAAALGDSAMQGGSLARLDAECDRAVDAYLAAAGRVSFGVEPLISYICAVESEIKTLRRAVSGRLAGLAPEQIRERLWQ